MIKTMLTALLIASCSGTTKPIAPPTLDCTSPGDKTALEIVLTDDTVTMPACTAITDPRFAVGPGRYWCCEKAGRQ